MKRCPACNTTYGDEQNFCLNDGSSLVADTSGSYGSGAQTNNPPYGRSAAPTEVMYGTPTAQPTPPPYIPPAALPARKRSPLPWILLGVVLVAGIVVAIIFATRSSGGDGATTSNPTNSTTTTNGTRTGSTGTTTNTATMTTTSGPVYNSPDGKFSITLPPGFSQFTSQKTTQQTLAGPIELNILQSEIPSGGCVLGYSDFPEASFQGRTPQKMLEDGRDGALKNMGATLEKQDNLTVQGRTAINVYGSTTSGGKPFYVRFQFVLDKPRAYQIGYLAYNRSDLDKPDVQAYFDSFRLK
jgi:hypothetical protein